MGARDVVPPAPGGAGDSTIRTVVELVLQGRALAWYPEGGVPVPDYAPQQREAEAAWRGVWSSRPIDPWHRRYRD